MARLTKGTFLMISEDQGATYKKLADITEYPDLDEAPDSEDTTTLSDPAHTYIQALPDTGGTKEFPCWLDSAKGAEIDQLTDEQYISIWIGGTESAGVITPTGSILRWNTIADVQYLVTGAAVGDVAPATVAITPKTAPVKIWNEAGKLADETTGG